MGIINIRRVLLGLLGLCLCLTVFTEMVPAEPLAIETGKARENLPAVACHFDSSVRVPGDDALAQRAEWYFWREPTQIETRDAAGETSEIWQRSHNGPIFYQLVFHEDKLVIEYTPAELRAAQHYPDWSHLASMIDPQFLKTYLKKTGKTQILGRQAQGYHGYVNGIELEVWWLETEQLPALLRQVYADREVRLDLKAIHPLDKAPWPRSQTAQYRHLDFADLDKQEPDLVARSLRPPASQQKQAPASSGKNHNPRKMP